MKTVLVVDDEARIRRLIRVIVEGEGHSVIESDDGDAAWLLIQQLRPGIVVSDVCMPGRSGFDLARAIRADPDLADTRVVLVSGRALEREDRRAGLIAGADRYLTKPFSPVRLLAFLEASTSARARAR